ncbi:hypothetical protein HanPSC8_Chr14g0633841 [Helianthus annuus]|nr:hypothetical protein HanPSC8_Chr14g0633841 [Helianthus annuus]
MLKQADIFINKSQERVHSSLTKSKVTENHISNYAQFIYDSYNISNMKSLIL